jgi:hypothetical protein
MKNIVKTKYYVSSILFWIFISHFMGINISHGQIIEECGL